MERKIEVSYDGKYPNACSGTLIIKVDGEEIYNDKFCCGSGGSVWFDKNWDEHVAPGKLTWNDAEKFDRDVQVAVEEVLSRIDVCCGGCI